MTVDQFLSYVIGLLQTLGVWEVLQVSVTAMLIVVSALSLIKWFRG